MKQSSYLRGFLPFALAAGLIGLVGGFSTVLGPAFMADMGLDYENTTWSALAQAISTAACAPILGKLGDLWGGKRTLLWGMVVFTAGNALTALAGGLGILLLSRFVVGLGTAAMAPTILAYIVTKFPPHAVGKGFSLYMLLSGGTVVFGPTLGALTVDAYGWRAMSWLCTALCAVILLLCLFSSRGVQDQRKPLTHFDGAGAVLIFLFFGLSLCVPSFLQIFGPKSAAFWAVLGLALVGLVALWQVERRAKKPILRGSFLGQRSFVVSVLALFLSQGLLQANMTNLLVFYRYTLPENTIVSGYAISVLYLGMSIGAVLFGPLADRYEPKKILFGSFLLTAAGVGWMLLFSQRTPAWLAFASLGCLGLGLGGNATIFLKVVLSGIPASEAGAATGTYGLFRDLAAPFGVAVLVPLFTGAVTENIVLGIPSADAAVAAMGRLAWVELAALGAGILLLPLLPKIHKGKGTDYEIAK